MTSRLDAIQQWIIPSDPDLREQRTQALAETRIFYGLLLTAIACLASFLAIGKLPAAWLVGGAIVASGLALCSVLIIQRHRNAAVNIDQTMPATEPQIALLGLLVAGYAGFLIASPGFATTGSAGSVSTEHQIALIMLGLLAPLPLVRALGASGLAFIATAVPLMLSAAYAVFWMQASLTPLLQGAVLLAIALIAEHTLRTVRTTDLAMRSRTRERSLVSQQLALFSTSQLGIAQTVNGKIGRANARFRQWFGEGTGDALIADMASSIGLSTERVQRLINRADSRIEGHDSRNISILLNGATPRYFSVQVRRFDPSNATRGLLWTVSDQTSDWLSRKASERAATRDPLTGALNRRALHKRLSAMLVRDLRRQPFAVLCIDINRFGDLNNANGQGFGDQILCIVTRRVQRMLREQDVIARTGGNEFVLVLENVNGMERATKIAEKVMETLSAPIVLTSMTCSIAAAVGVAVAPAHGRRADEILSRARASMFAVKRTLIQVQAGHIGRRSP